MKKLLYASQRGFSLLEALIAALVVALAMLGLARLQGVTLINSGDSRMKTRALNLAQDKIEELRSFANKDTYTGMASGNDAPTSYAGDNSSFARTWTISSCPNSVDCKQVGVSVNWTDPKGDTQTVALTSYIASGDTVNSGVVLLAGTSSTSSGGTSSGGTSSGGTSSGGTSSGGTSSGGTSSGGTSSGGTSSGGTSSGGTSSGGTSSGGTSSGGTSSGGTSSGGTSSGGTSSGGGNTCSGLVTASLITGPFETEKPLKIGAEIDLSVNLNIDPRPNTRPPTAICTVLSLDLFDTLLNGGKKGTYICNIQDLDPAIVNLDIGGKEVGLSVNLALGDVLPSNLLNLLSPLLDILHLPKAEDGSPQVACVNAKVNLPISIDANANVRLEDLCVVPNLIGKTVDVADGLLKKAGFTYGLNGNGNGNGNGNNGKIVQTQDHPAGSIASCSGLKIGVGVGGKNLLDGIINL